jgi:predicted MFS family arabinose efflux permease
MPDTTGRPTHPTPGRAARISTRVAFFIGGFGPGAWAPLVPFAKARAGLDDGVLGLLLLCLGLGSVVTMPAAGALAARFGCRIVIVVAALLMCAALPVLATAASLSLLVPAMLVFGAGMGCLDVTMNIQAVIVERASDRPLMSGFHGQFSAGGIAGAAGATALLAAGASPLATTLCAVAVAAVALATVTPHLLPYGSRGAGPAFAVPHGIVLLIGALCFVLFLAEGAVLDWSAVALNSIQGLDLSHAGFGYAAFALTMTVGRLSGDRIVARVGGTRIVVIGGICAALGFATAALVPAVPVALLGYALVGVGAANIVPVLFSLTGRQKVMPEHIAVPAITTLGYAGVLAGPAGIGAIAHVAGLPAAFLVLAAMLLSVAASSRLLRQ